MPTTLGLTASLRRLPSLTFGLVRLRRTTGLFLATLGVRSLRILPSESLLKTEDTPRIINGGVCSLLFEPTLRMNSNRYPNSTRPNLRLQGKEVVNIFRPLGRATWVPFYRSPSLGLGLTPRPPRPAALLPIINGSLRLCSWRVCRYPDPPAAVSSP